MRWLVGWSSTAAAAVEAGSAGATGYDGETVQPVGSQLLWGDPDPLWAVGDWRPDEVRVVAVGMDLEGARVLAPFAEHYGLNYPVLLADESIIAGQSAFGPIQALPTTVILDREGRAVAAWQGVAGHEDVSKAIEKTLGR